MRAIALVVCLAACQGASEVGGADARTAGVADAGPGQDPFARDHVLEVALTLPPADWDELRMQLRSLFECLQTNDCLASPFASPFTKFDAEVALDGIAYGRVTVRKKGYLSSWSETKPGLKIDLGAYGAQRYLGLRELVLNNTIQDPSYVRQCLAVDVFEAAGVPHGRCHFAHVTVNGADLGVYVHVEDIDDELVAARGGRELYKGLLSDFAPAWVGSFDADRPGGDRAALAAVVDALAAPEDQVLARLAAVVDLEAFERAWAVESLLGHWDGYFANQNNFFVYRDASGRFAYVPWGTDQVMQPGRTPGAYTTALLPQRLLRVAPDDYVAHLRAALEVWDEAALRAEAEHLYAIVAPRLPPGERDRVRAEVSTVEAYIDARRALALAAIEGGITGQTALRPPPCIPTLGHVTATFSTTYGSLEAGWAAGTATMVGGPADAAWPLDGMLTAQAGDEPGNPANGLLRFWAELPDGRLLIVDAVFEKPRWQIGTQGFAMFVDPTDNVCRLTSCGSVWEHDGAGWVYQAARGRGGVSFTAAGTSPGDVVTGTLDADLAGVPAR